jgi:hypothetical protein
MEDITRKPLPHMMAPVPRVQGPARMDGPTKQEAHSQPAELHDCARTPQKDRGQRCRNIVTEAA